jgi:hypothetical protein
LGVGEPISHNEVHDISDIPESAQEQANSPAPYEYKMVELSPAFTPQGGHTQRDEVARYLQAVANEQAEQGWEFYRVDTLGIGSRSGLLAKLFGHKLQQYYVASFRRPK